MIFVNQVAICVFNDNADTRRETGVAKSFAPSLARNSLTVIRVTLPGFIGTQT